MEKRVFEAKFETRAGEDGGPILSGYAAPFNRLSVLLWGFKERIAPGAFRNLADGDIRALWQHDMASILGRTAAGTLRLWEDDQGLAFELHPPDTQVGRDALTLISRGDIDQMSFGFNTLPYGDDWEVGPDGTLIRTLNAVTLVEISPVTWAAYPQTTVGVRSERFLEELEAPDWVRRALAQSDDDNAEEARARLDLMRRRLQILEIE